VLLERLHRQSNLSLEALEHYASTASKRYKKFYITKRDGGARLIEHPSRELKLLQKWLSRTLFERLPTHPSAKAYSKGASIFANAFPHVRSPFTLRVDFNDFFPSFSADHVERFLKSGVGGVIGGLSARDISFVSRVVCRNGRLTIGAPSSPKITNVMMFPFDDAMQNWCSERRFIYTRYADDIFVSTHAANKLKLALSELERLAAEFPFASLTINTRKTKFLSRKHHRSITGLVITPDRKISIGLERKRELKELIYKYKCKKFDESRFDEMRGMLAFAYDVEPRFYETLQRKYGEEIIMSIKKGDRDIKYA